VLRIGKTEEGRDSVIVFVGSEDSISHLDENRRNLARLADPRGLTDAEAHDLIAKTKPIYTLSGGLHSAELGPPEMLMELAYRLITEDSPLVQKHSLRTSSSPSCRWLIRMDGIALSTGTSPTTSTSPTTKK
jgi:hypothetical protein